MLNRPVVHELDSNSIFLREQEIALHRKKLTQIKNRKNPYEIESSTSLFQKRFSKMKFQAEKVNPFGGFHNSLHIKKNNNYLTNKINKISKRSNKTIFPDFLQQSVRTRNRFNESIRYLKEKQLIEDNQEFSYRLNHKTSCINIRKIEEDFVLHQKLIHKLKRIKPKQSSIDITIDNTLSILFDLPKSSFSKPKSTPKIKYTSQSKSRNKFNIISPDSLPMI